MVGGVLTAVQRSRGHLLVTGTHRCNGDAELKPDQLQILSARKIAVIGLGYVGLPVAVAFARAGNSVVGFDVDRGRIAELKSGHDRTCEVPRDDLLRSELHLALDQSDLSRADFFVITVPIPIDDARRPICAHC